MNQKEGREVAGSTNHAYLDTMGESMGRQKSGPSRKHHSREERSHPASRTATIGRDIPKPKLNGTSVQVLLYEDPENHEPQQLTTTRNWLAQHGQVFKEIIRRVRLRAIQNVRSIRSYFSTAGGG
jgi:hypothetical protein